MEKAFDVAFNLYNKLGEYETKLHEIYDNDNDIFSIEHQECRELIKEIRLFREKISERAAKMTENIDKGSIWNSDETAGE